MLAYANEARIEQYCERGLVTATPYTITSPEILRLELAEIRGQGYAINRGEWHMESCGIAVPLLDHAGEASPPSASHVMHRTSPTAS